MDWADDVAYSVHDLEDAVHAGHLVLDVLHDNDERDALVQLAASRYAEGASTDELLAALDRLINLDYWPAKFDDSHRAMAMLKHTTSELIGRFCTAAERATREHPLRSSVVHPITRINEQTSCGRGIPVINVGFDDSARQIRIEMIPKGSGSENGSFLQMLIPAQGIDGIKTFVVDKVIELGGRVCPPTIVGVGVGGTSDVCMHLAKVAATRPLGSACEDPEGEKLEKMLSIAVNSLGIGPQGLGGRGTSFAVHVETAATHITMNPVAVNIQCHSARRASAVISAQGVSYGF